MSAFTVGCKRNSHHVAKVGIYAILNRLRGVGKIPVSCLFVVINIVLHILSVKLRKRLALGVAFRNRQDPEFATRRDHGPCRRPRGVVVDIGVEERVVLDHPYPGRRHIDGHAVEISPHLVGSDVTLIHMPSRG